ncbi:MAG: CBS domain-containing protein [SAR86 cluster bacterium]|nr:CBS domain-containing protein [SAR86 cluster bacterium]
MSKSKQIKTYLAGQRYWEVFVIKASETVTTACEIMEKNRIGALLVVDAKSNENNNNVVGIITERDIVKTIAHHQHKIEYKRVDEVMSNKLISAEPDTSTEEAISLMVENQIRHLAVMEDNKLLGVISMRDIFYSVNYLSDK